MSESGEVLKCCARLRSIYSDCGKKAKQEHKGKWYCAAHYPPTMDEKYRKADEAKAREREQRREAERQHRLREDIVKRIFRVACVLEPDWPKTIAWASSYFKPGDEALVQGWIDEVARKNEEKNG